MESSPLHDDACTIHDPGRIVGRYFAGYGNFLGMVKRKVCYIPVSLRGSMTLDPLYVDMYACPVMHTDVLVYAFEVVKAVTTILTGVYRVFLSTNPCTVRCILTSVQVPTRPVVEVEYEDGDGEELYLDQLLDALMPLGTLPNVGEKDPAATKWVRC